MGQSNLGQSIFGQFIFVLVVLLCCMLCVVCCVLCVVVGLNPPEPPPPHQSLRRTPIGWTAQNFAFPLPLPFRFFFSLCGSSRVFFFSLSEVFSCLFFSLWGSSRGILVVFWSAGALKMCAFSPSGWSVKPRRLRGRWGFTRKPENSKRAHFRASALHTPPKFHERTLQE